MNRPCPTCLARRIAVKNIKDAAARMNEGEFISMRLEDALNVYKSVVREHDADAIRRLLAESADDTSRP